MSHFLSRAGPRACRYCPALPGALWLTFSPRGEEFLEGVVEPDPKGGGAYLSLEASGQPAVELHGPFCSGQSGDCSQDAFIPNGTRGLAFTLDLERRKIQVRGE